MLFSTSFGDEDKKITRRYEMLKKLIFSVLVFGVAGMAAAAPVGYWNFDEGSGTAVADSSGNSNVGVIVSKNSANYPDWTTGFDGTGSALEFNASTTSSSNSNFVQVDIDGSNPLASLADAFTISMWVKREAENTIWPYLVYTDAYDYELAMDPNGSSSNLEAHDFFWSELDTNWQLDLGSEPYAQQAMSVWNHIALSFDGNYLKKYVNGTMVYASAPSAAFSAVATTDLFIAARTGGSAYYVGALDDVAIWSGRYVPASEIAKLAAGTATPLTVTDAAAIPPLPENYFTKETQLAWTSEGWKLFWSASFEWDVNVASNNTATGWWFDGSLLPGTRTSCWDMNKWFMKDLDSGTYSHPVKDVESYGIEWIDPSWSGRSATTAVFAAYITPGIAFCQMDEGYQGYDPQWSWTLKDYFKTYARVAAVNAGDAQLRVKVYTYTSGTDPFDPANLTYLDEVYWPLNGGDDYEWQDLRYAFPKPTAIPKPRVWVEISIAGGNPDTLVYIDEFNSVSDQANTSQHTASYLPGDFDEDAIVNQEDLQTFAAGWLSSSSGMLEPRSGEMLDNGDFSADYSLLNIAENEPLITGIAPAGWDFEGTPSSGNYGIAYVADRGRFNYSAGAVAPLGASTAAYTMDPNMVLTQTANTGVTAGQTYYAMAYVMTRGYLLGFDDWRGWKDFVTLTLEIDGVDVASFERVMSRERWRPLYGTYTATATDAGKPIKVKISYANSHTAEIEDAGYAYIGYVYLADMAPADWPDGRDNMLSNGGFDEIDWLIGTPLEPVYNSIHNSDNWGAWLVSGVPAPINWLYEVPSGYDLANKGGMWASGMYGTPLPSPGMEDVCFYTSNTLVLGQVIGALNNGTTYYMDMACGVNSSDYSSTAWPDPAPSFHIELWRIPAGVTDGTVIYDGISSSAAGYTKIAETYTDATGNISGGSGAGVVAAKWQLVGTSYTATAADTNVYLRVYGANGAATNPEFAFSDVYLSTAKRLVPGGDYSFEIQSGMQYDAYGPLNCYHGELMGTSAPATDINGDCRVDLYDYAYLANSWLDDWFNNITGTTPWE